MIEKCVGALNKAPTRYLDSVYINPYSCPIYSILCKLFSETSIDFICLTFE